MKSLVLVLSLIVGSAYAQSRTVAGYFSDELDYRLNQVVQRIDEQSANFQITHSDVSALFGKKCKITIDDNFKSMNGVDVFQILDEEDKHFAYYSIAPTSFDPELSGDLTVTKDGGMSSYLKSDYIDLNFLAESSKCHSKEDFVELLERKFPKNSNSKLSIFDDERSASGKIESLKKIEKIDPSTAVQQ